ncbi:hypothetical protein F4692_001345 [Nocardioides cavernae]|uniref:DUF3303 domain-containing protein n=1 Tax=Nocardioides cavernae TaxID=1921566 RepID=A0A7Y9H235_9ACTN|nr:hypothetical protein [Nocardioides cavernae]NYE36241.1 hypothetical protein [Nocardioides cavernae]
MPEFRLCHHHTPDECGAAVASWRGSTSPLRGRPATASCAFGGHHVWWDVEADDREAALSLLPGFVAHRTEVVRVTALDIP